MKILVTAPYSKEGIGQLEQRYGEVLYLPWNKTGKVLNEEKMLELMDREKPDAVITELDLVTKGVIERYPGLRFIGDCRATPVNVDIEAASACGIPVIVTPARNAQAVAELLVASLIGFLRKIPQSIEWSRQGNWKKGGELAYFQFQGRELAGKKVGFVGYGAVARSASAILQSFPCAVCCYDPFVTDAGIEQVELEELFQSCDVVSLHLPVTKETQGMIGRSLLESMKPDAILVNTARSSVLDMKALTDLLQKKKIGGAVLDVYDHEPPQAEEMELFRMENVLATPHIGGATRDVVRHQSRIMNERLAGYFDKKDLEIAFNAQELKERTMM